MSDYNGWKNRATWNVALWIGNKEELYSLACRCTTYTDFMEQVRRWFGEQTPDGIAWDDPSLDFQALDELIADMK